MTKQQLLKGLSMEETKIRYLFENSSMPKYQGMLWVDFAFGTGINHECDDVICEFHEMLKYCLSKLSSLFKAKLKFHNLLRLVANRHGNNVSFLLNFHVACFEDRHTLVVTPNGIFLIKNATDKVYLFLRSSGFPLVTFASSKKEGRGIFDGRHLYFGKKIHSSLPERLDLKTEGDNYKSNCFSGGEELIVGNELIAEAKIKKEKGVIIVEF